MFTGEEFIEAYIHIIRKESGNELFDLDQNQKEAILYSKGPLMISAGPGTGKTEVLSLRCVKHLIVDRIPAKSLIITTFTKKAANQLIEKISRCLTLFRETYGYDNFKDIVESELIIGTLHSICNIIMTYYKYDKFSNHRIIDEKQQRMLMYERSKYVSNNVPHPDEEHTLEFWNRVNFLSKYGAYQWECGNIPSKRCRVKYLTQLINRATEYGHTVDSLKNRSKDSDDYFYEYLANAMNDYHIVLESSFLCDQTTLQRKFLDFLGTIQGKMFLNGDGSKSNPGIKCLLIDEYQDTNPIQESIYFKIAEMIDGNICVVGDEDQALYRFRGGSVESMTLFDQRIKEYLELNEPVRIIQLKDNYRSHKEIIDWINFQISSRKEMNFDGARSPNKQSLIPKSGIEKQGEWTAVGKLTRVKTKSLNVDSIRDALAADVVELIDGLLKNKIVSDPNQICVLSHSTDLNKNGFISKLQKKLIESGIDVYNPTSKDHHTKNIIMEYLGVLFLVLDADRETREVLSCENGYKTTIKYINECKSYANKLIGDSRYNDLKKYVEASRMAIMRNRSDQNDRIIRYDTEDGNASKDSPTIRSICYNILNYSPFIDHIDEDSVEAYYLQSILDLISSYATIPSKFDSINSKDKLTRDKDNSKAIDKWLVFNLYALVFDILCTEGMDEPENNEVIIPNGKLPIMTIHASKGLEFPIVIVYNYRRGKIKENAEHILEDMFKPKMTESNALTRSQQDLVRLYYVAYSRAKYALILVSENNVGNNPPQAWGGVQNNTVHIDYMNDLMKNDRRWRF